MRLRGGAAVTAMLAFAVAGCTDATTGSAGPGVGSSAGSASAASAGRAVGPLENPDGTKPGLAPVTTDAGMKAARKLIEELSTKGRGPKTGYDRDEFGYAWMDTADGVPLARNGCDTRIISLGRVAMDLFSQRMQGVVGCA
jgi:hypothetical protein